MSAEQEQALTALVNVLERLDIPYLVGGSVASSIYGVPRMTRDVDIVAFIASEHVVHLVEALQDSFYVDASAVRDAISRRDCFNVIHLASVVKIDVFIADSSEWMQRQWERRVRSRLADSPNSPEVNLASPEDVILNKLRWYRMGGGISTHQWQDVLGILQVRGADVDRAYLIEWAARLGLSDLLERVFQCIRLPD